LPKAPPSLPPKPKAPMGVGPRDKDSGEADKPDDSEGLSYG
jgi:hypothetical protein